MPDLNLALRLTADGKGFVGEVRVARQELDKLSAASGRAGRGARRQATGQQAANAAMRRGAVAARQQAAAQQAATTAVQNSAGAVALLVTRFAGYIGAALIAIHVARRIGAAVIRLLDGYTDLNNALRQVSTSEVGLVSIRQRLLAVSLRTRTALDANSQLYRRISLSAQETGHSQAQLLRVTELLNKQVAIGGNNASEAAAGLVQFAQGLASGRLQGDELRSVMENLLGVQDGLVTGFRALRERGQIAFDVTRGNIRDLAAEGKLTADLLIEAILASADDTERKFKDVEISVSGGLQNMESGALALTGRIDELTGASRFLARITSSIGDVLADMAQTDLSELVAEYWELTRALEGLPGFLRPLLEGAYERRLAELEERITAIRAAATGDPVRPAQRAEQAAAARAAQPTALSAVSGELQGLIENTFSAAEQLRRGYQADLKAIKAGGQALEAALEEQGLTLRDLIRGRQRQLGDDLAKLSEGSRPASATAARSRRESDPFPDLLGQAGESRADRLYSADAIEQAHAARLEQERRQQRELAQQRREAERRERAAREQAFRDRLAQAAGFADAEVQQQALRDEAIIALRYQSVRQVGQVVALANRLQYQEGIQAIQTGLEIARQGADALASQSKAAFRIYKATAIAQTIISTYQGAQDAYASGLKVPAPAPIPQIIAVAAAAAAVAAGIGRVNAIRNQRQPQAFARGGVVDSPTFFSARGLPSGLAGEAGPEAILPLRRGPRGLGVDASVAAPRPVVINITLGDIHVEGGDDPARAGRDLSDMLVRRIRTEMRRVIADEQRPGGLFNRTERVG